MLRLEKVRFSHPGQTGDYRFDLEVAPGTIVGITGASGAGKSTLLDLIAGFLAPASGNIELDGGKFSHQPPQRRPVSILFQADNLFDHLTVARNLELVLPKNLDPAERKIAISTALEKTGLNGFERRRAASLSGGQKQRLALARTLLLDRPVLLLDEPFSALDGKAAKDLGALLVSMVRQNGWHCVLVSHQTEALGALADQVVHLEAGRLGPAALEVNSRPRS